MRFDDKKSLDEIIKIDLQGRYSFPNPEQSTGLSIYCGSGPEGLRESATSDTETH